MARRRSTNDDSAPGSLRWGVLAGSGTILLVASALALWGLRGVVNAYQPEVAAGPERIAATQPDERPAPPAAPLVETRTVKRAEPAPLPTRLGERTPPEPADEDREATIVIVDDPPPPDLGPPPQRRRQPNVESGVGLFPAPGTKPLIPGVVVPDEFELPEGFLRHYQATDEGEQLEPILLLHPDYELLDEDGEPIQLGPDRVVPPELVPDGMPVRRIELPKDGGLPRDGP